MCDWWICIKLSQKITFLKELHSRNFIKSKIKCVSITSPKSAITPTMISKTWISAHATKPYVHMQHKSTNKIVTCQILETCYTIYSYKETQCFVLRDFPMVKLFLSHVFLLFSFPLPVCHWLTVCWLKCFCLYNCLSSIFWMLYFSLWCNFLNSWLHFYL